MKREVPKPKRNPACNVHNANVIPEYLPHKALRDRLNNLANSMVDTIEECREEWHRIADRPSYERGNAEHMVSERTTQAYTRLHQIEYLVDYMIEDIVFDMEQELASAVETESDDYVRGFLAAAEYLTSKELNRGR